IDRERCDDCGRGRRAIEAGRAERGVRRRAARIACFGVALATIADTAGDTVVGRRIAEAPRTRMRQRRADAAVEDLAHHGRGARAGARGVIRGTAQAAGEDVLDAGRDAAGREWEERAEVRTARAGAVGVGQAVLRGVFGATEGLDLTRRILDRTIVEADAAVR